MIFKTRGIVLKYIKYRETSIIVNIYTEALGLQSFIVNSVRSARSKRAKIALYQPLTLVDLVVYHKEKNQLQRISEIKCGFPFKTIPINSKKSAVALFLVEILGKTLKEQTGNTHLFTFLWDSLTFFDTSQENVENFHLIFLQRLSQWLGFGAQNTQEIMSQIREMSGAPVLNSSETYILNQILEAEYSTALEITNLQRQNLLQTLLFFYQWHVEQFKPIKSLTVLNQIFS